MLNPTELVIGPAYVATAGVDSGLTTEDGVELTPDIKNVDYQGAQSLVISETRRTAVGLMLSAEFNQLTLEKFRVLQGMQTAPSNGSLDGKWSPAPTKHTIILTMPGPAGATRVLTATATVEKVGGTKANNVSFAGVKVDFKLLGDPTTNKYYTLVETASATTVPAAASYQKIVGSTETAITDGATAVELAAKVQVTFNVAIRADQLTNSKLLLKANDTNVAVACAIGFGTTTGATDRTKIVLTPSAALTASTEYELVVTPGLMSADSIPTAAAYGLRFTTASS